MGLTGLLLGAGASFDIGMPLALELTQELKNWLTPSKIRWLNDEWRKQGGGYSDAAIDDFARILTVENMNYEHITGYLEVQRERISERRQEYHGLLGFLSEIIYALLKERHVKNESFIERNIKYLDGINKFLEANKPLWVFSLNHDLLMECFCAHAGIQVKDGFGNEIVRLPRRDEDGNTTGELEARVTRSEALTRNALDFFRAGEEGINLFKIHGSLDEFSFNDGNDLLKLSPIERSVRGVLSALRIANDEVRYIDPRWPGKVVRATNEIAYADAQGEMQFLRRTPLAGVFKFQGQSSQNVPNELLSFFTLGLGYLSSLVCIGYGFRDLHINQAIRNWLEGSEGRHLTVVDPCMESIPSMVAHLFPQIDLVEQEATDYLDGMAEISRTREEMLERQLSAQLRKLNREEAALYKRQYRDHLIGGVVERASSWIKTLPFRDGDVDLEQLGLTPDEFKQLALERAAIPSAEEALEEFLKQATISQ